MQSLPSRSRISRQASPADIAAALYTFSLHLPQNGVLSSPSNDSQSTSQGAATKTLFNMLSSVSGIVVRLWLRGRILPHATAVCKTAQRIYPTESVRVERARLT